MSSSDSGIPSGSISNSQADVYFQLGGIPDSSSASASNAVLDRPCAVTQSSPLDGYPLQKPQDTPSTSLTTASPNAIQNSHFVGFRHPIPTATTMVHEPMLFCGPNFSKDTKSWSTYHPLPSDGRFDIDDKSLRAIVDGENDLMIEAALRKATSVGEAAGRIYVQWALRPGFRPDVNVKPECMALSGFWLGQGFFVTSAHWVKKIEEGAPRKAVVDDMMDPQKSMVMISERNTSEGAARKLDHRAHLWRLDEASDIAIFRTQLGRDPRKASVELSQLAVPQSHSSPLPIWTVAYSCYDSKLDSPEGKEFLQEQKEKKERNQEIVQKGPQTIFEYLAHGYLDSLASTLEGSKIIGAIQSVEASGIPEFEKLFKPTQKALAVGRVLPQDDNLPQDSAEGEGQQGKRKYTQERVHNISGYFGCSGAMIGTLNANNEVDIVGIFNGGHNNQPMNVFTAFTGAGIQWIADSIRPLEDTAAVS